MGQFYFGADIFFVISGFLITSQLLQEIEARTFSFGKFYKRRINRLLPALVTVVGVSLVVGIFLLTPADLTRLTSSAFASLLGLSNIFFWREYGNYFAGDSAEAILLHTWSLGVEEQFYVIWPVVLLILIRFIPRLRFPVLFAGTLVAIAVSEYATNNFASASYYLLPTRFFELMMGGVLAMLPSEAQPRSNFASSMASYMGLVLIGGSLVALNGESPFPGYRAAVPCLGAALLIWAGMRGQHSRLLSSRPMVFLGLISYSLYLWHWPIVAYLNYAGIPLRISLGSVVATASVFLAWLTWKYVEVPFRHQGASLPFARVVLRRFALPALAVLSLAICSIYFHGFPGRFDPLVAAMESTLASRPEVLRKGCHVPTALYRTEASANCRLGAKKDEVDAILIGDSFANHFTGMIDVLASADRMTVMDYTMDGCAPILGYTKKQKGSYAQKCALRNEHAFDLVASTPFKFVVLAGSWPDTEEAGSAIELTLRKVVDTGAQAIVILKNQTIPRAASCPVRRLVFSSSTDCSTSQTGPPAYWDGIRARLPSVRFIDPNELICRAGRCSPVVANTLIYRDGSHLNDIGSRRLGYLFLEAGKSLVDSGKILEMTVGTTGPSMP